ncbi:MAG TPA: ABC transporter permease [Ochrobactrum intermedium]|uniref:ABC transporter permease n=1 Tax=Brucella intermedia TaxID=94625 RepID=A0A7V6PEM7_9HYPH|nr:ABC transporter permease [Brucella intermedia]HHV69460.1 ABC transporter permease [Brucella intermedia]
MSQLALDSRHQDGILAGLKRVAEGPLVVPLLIFLCAVLVPPFVFVFLTSFGEKGWTAGYYLKIISQPLYQKVFLNTLEIGGSTAVLSIFLGYFVALHLSRCSRRKRALYLMLVMLPFWTSILVKSFAFTIILGTGGVINGVIETVFGPGYKLAMIFNRVGVIIGLTHWLLPFAVFPILSSLLAQDRNLPVAAEIMGASRLRIFWTITFPQTLPAIGAGAIMVAVIAMGSFVTPALLGGRGDLMLANMVDFYIREALDWPMASAIAMALIFIAGAVALALQLIRTIVRAVRP